MLGIIVLAAVFIGLSSASSSASSSSSSPSSVVMSPPLRTSAKPAIDPSPLNPGSKDGPFSPCSPSECATIQRISECFCGTLRFGNITTLDYNLTTEKKDLYHDPPNTNSDSVCFSLKTDFPDDSHLVPSITVTVGDFISIIAKSYTGCFYYRGTNPFLQVTCSGTDSYCFFHLTFAYYGYPEGHEPSLPPNPTATTVPNPAVYEHVALLERVKSSCVTHENTVMLPGACVYECTNTLQVLNVIDQTSTILLRPKPLTKCYCDTDIMKSVIVSENSASGSWRYGVFNMSSAQDEEANHIMFELALSSQDCQMFYEVVWGKILGISDSDTKGMSSGSSSNQEAITGIVFCAILVVGGVILVVRRNLVHRKTRMALKDTAVPSYKSTDSSQSA
jgi:hypothetical protein